LTLAGSIAWSLDGAPFGRSLIFLSTILLAVALVILSQTPAGVPVSAGVSEPVVHDPFALDALTSAAVLGLATTAMLMGHSYLIAPAMSLSPLMRLMAALVVVVVVRMFLAATGLWSWRAHVPASGLETEMLVWLPVRWVLGFVAPLVLVWMAWQSARIRSTQSATGILYVVVIFCFLGELTSQLLLEKTGYIL
jgi:hypothetical protein